MYTLRIKKGIAKEDFKVALLGPQSSLNRVKELLMVEDAGKAELYAVMNMCVREFVMAKHVYGEEVVKLEDDIINKAAICGSLIVYITKSNKVYLQVLQTKLQ